MIRTVTAALMLTAAPAFAACNTDPAPCSLTGGTYHIALPATPSPYPAVVFLHGWGGSGEGTMRNTGMVNAFLARGYAVIAPDGQPRTDATGQPRPGRSWDFNPGRAATRDEVAFLKAAADDAAERFDLIRDDMLLAGFSIGGSMTSYAACKDPGAFATYAPVAGSFWRPAPTACKGPVRLLHTHGWADQTVPLEGRILAPGIAQGDVFQALDIWRQTNGCTAHRPDQTDTSGPFQTRTWTACSPGATLTFALHNGGHTIPKDWAALALDWLKTLP